MSATTILLPIVRGVDQTPVIASVAITLVDLEGAPIVAQTTAGGVTGGTRLFSTALDGELPTRLIPNSELAPESAYRLILSIPEGIQRAWTVQVPASESAIPWEQLIGMGGEP